MKPRTQGFAVVCVSTAGSERTMRWRIFDTIEGANLFERACKKNPQFSDFLVISCDLADLPAHIDYTLEEFDKKQNDVPDPEEI